jgi:vancomycin permeability regulator SanA
MGIDAIGISADQQSYQRIVFFWYRDMLASIKAWWDINIWAPQPPA